MRLIDKDALEALVREVYEYDLCHDDADEYMEGRTSAGHGALEKIRDAPTIDAIPIELTAKRLGRAFFSEPEKWADWLRMIRDGIDEEQEGR